MNSEEVRGIIDNSEDLLQINSILWEGCWFWKIPFHALGNAKRKYLRIKHLDDSHDLARNIIVTPGNSIQKVAYPLALEIFENSNAKRARQNIKFNDIVAIRKDSFSEAFNAFRAKHGPAALPHHSLCFSIVTIHRTFDLYAESPSATSNMLEEILNLMGSLSLASVKGRQPPKKQWEVDSLKKKQFFAAAKAGDVAKFQWYLRQGFDIETEENDERKDTALIAACRLGRTNIVDIALEFDAKNDP